MFRTVIPGPKKVCSKKSDYSPARPGPARPGPATFNLVLGSNSGVMCFIKNIQLLLLSQTVVAGDVSRECVRQQQTKNSNATSALVSD